MIETSGYFMQFEKKNIQSMIKRMEKPSIDCNSKWGEKVNEVQPMAANSFNQMRQDTGPK